MRILFIGDIYGSMGRDIIAETLKDLRSEKKINLVIANGENIAHGVGINSKYYHWLLEQGVNVVTLGNHAFVNTDIINFIKDAKNLVRPLNYGPTTPGVGYLTLNYNGIKVTVMQVMGKTFMNPPLDCPFAAAKKVLDTVPSDIYLCDIHGEATSEKIAFGLYFDGRIQAIVGTHTHVQTNDAHILDKGTFYMSDLGMTGARDGVIGVDPKVIMPRYLDGVPVKHLPMMTGKKQLCGAIVEINDKTHKVTNYEVVNIVK